MKLWGIVTASVAVVLALGVSSDAARCNTKNCPGWCKDQDDCEKGYSCIAVQTTRGGTEEVKQCLPYKYDGDVCTGIHSGYCPIFPNWPRSYKQMSSVCAHIVPKEKCVFDGSAPEKGEIPCIQIKDQEDEEVGVIYGCVDYDGRRLLFKNNDPSDRAARTFNYTDVLEENCVNPRVSDVLCSGRGTCAPDNRGQMDYRCRCHVGYEGTYCQKIVSNKCTIDAQCSVGRCDKQKQECVCNEGYTGLKCDECDPSSDSVCGRNGECKAQEVEEEEEEETPAPTTEEPSEEPSNSPSDSPSNSPSASPSSSPSSSPSPSPDAGSEEEEVFFFHRNLATKNMCVCKEGWAGADCGRSLAKQRPGLPDNREKNRTPAPQEENASAVLVPMVASVAALFVVAMN